MKRLILKFLLICRRPKQHLRGSKSNQKVRQDGLWERRAIYNNQNLGKDGLWSKACPQADDGRPKYKEFFFKNFKNNNHNLIQKVQAVAFLQLTILQCILQNTEIEIIFLTREAYTQYMHKTAHMHSSGPASERI